ncbi:hypothetical protein [Lentilactobacillus diolivorans]|uniref:Uncharacterized protein n=1 Tax=Lentilactobacillus diolivorans TaxID=179838 RepID=A0ABQ0XF52_9LACO|nr:hypothetical protein [Lentilactobacillus diolivorans]GEP24520.1 hypothetical protein LDI01_21130 [Lentilactobacillus diolivorans]
MKFDWQYSFIFSLPIFATWLTLVIYTYFVSSTLTWQSFLIALAVLGCCLAAYYFLFQRGFYQAHPKTDPRNRIFNHSGIITTINLIVCLTAYFLYKDPLIVIGIMSFGVFIQAGNSVPK